MAYPTGMLGIVLESIDTRILKIKQTTQSLRDDLAAGNVTSGRILSYFQYIRAERAALVTAAATPGLTTYAQNEKQNGTLNIVAEFNTVIAAIDGTTTWISTNFPKDGSGFLLERTLAVDGPVERTFTPATTATFRSQLDALVATIQ